MPKNKHTPIPLLTEAPATGCLEDKLQIICEYVSEIAKSKEFDDWVAQNRVSSVYGHCAAAVDAMQILAWVELGKYLQVRRIDMGDRERAHFILQDPLTGAVYDPTRFQFHELGIMPRYKESHGVGLNARRKSGLQTVSDYTVSRAAREILRRLGYA